MSPWMGPGLNSTFAILAQYIVYPIYLKKTVINSILMSNYNHIYTHTQTYLYKHTYTHTHIYTHRHTQRNTHTHTYTHRQTQIVISITYLFFYLKTILSPTHSYFEKKIFLKISFNTKTSRGHGHYGGFRLH